MFAEDNYFKLEFIRQCLLTRKTGVTNSGKLSQFDDSISPGVKLVIRLLSSAREIEGTFGAESQVILQMTEPETTDSAKKPVKKSVKKKVPAKKGTHSRKAGKPAAPKSSAVRDAGSKKSKAAKAASVVKKVTKATAPKVTKVAKAKAAKPKSSKSAPKASIQAKSQFSKYEEFALKAIQATATDEKPYISSAKVKQYIFDYEEQAQSGQITKLVKRALTALVAKKFLKAKKDSYAFTVKGKKQAPENVQNRKKVVRPAKVLIKERKVDDRPKKPTITLSGRASRPVDRSVWESQS
jgi:hypothetical protein